MPEGTIIEDVGRNSRLIRKTFFEAGQDDDTEAPAQDSDLFELMENVMPPVNGTIDRRWGTSEFSNPGIRARRMFSVYFPVSYDVNGNATTADGRLRVVLTASNGAGGFSADNRVAIINHVGGVVNSTLYAPFVGADHPHCTVANTICYFADGTPSGLKWWNGFDASVGRTFGEWGMAWYTGYTPPTVTVTPDAGGVTLRAGRVYTFALRDERLGHTVLPLDTNGVPFYSESTGPCENATITVENLTNFGFGNVDKLILLATADGGDRSTLYEVAQLTFGDLTYTDTLAEDDLLSKNIWAEIDSDGRGLGLFDTYSPATVCPNGKYPTYYRGRMYLLQKNKLFYSKSIDEVTTSTGLITSRPEMSFAPDHVIELSTQDNEDGVGLLTDGANLYIGTVNGIKILSGDPPNHDGPTSYFYGVGIANQQTWKRVYHAGQASGAIWLTPDRMVIASDGNGYRDIGAPIQGTLDRATPTQFVSKAHAAFMTDGGQELYVLAIPVDGATECNRLLVYSIQNDRWVTWDMTGYENGVTPRTTNVLAMVGEQVPWLTPYNIGGPIGYFSSGTYSQLFKFRYDGTADFPNAPDVNDYVSGSQTNGLPTRAVLRTSWLDFNAPHMHTFLRTLDIMSAESASNITLKVEGADSVSTLNSPTTLVNATMRTGMHGKIFYPLATVAGKYRFYRFTLTFAPTATQDLLNYFSVRFRNAHMI